MIPLSKPYLSSEELNAVKEVLDSGWLTSGPKNKQFEEEFAKYIGVKYAISLNSCTSALELAIQSQNLKGEIIVPSFTFVASANSIVTSGCKPVFADIEPETCNISPDSVRKKISKKTVAIMPVHFAGQSCNIEEIMEIAQEYDLKIIEDSAEAIGSTWNGKMTGSQNIGCFSFFPTKNLTTGEGGMLTTNDLELAEKIRALRGHGIISSTFDRKKQKKPWFRAASFAGHNYRMPDLLAAIGIVQLKKLDEMNKSRIQSSKFLNEELSKVKGIETPVERKEAKHTYQMYTIKLSKKINRTKFIESLKVNGVQASVHFDPPVHLQPFYMKMNTKKSDLQITEDISRRIVTLPMYPGMSESELELIVSSVKKNL